MFAEKIDQLFDGRETSIARDLKMNLKNLHDNSSLSPQEYFLTVLALASAKHHSALRELAITGLRALNETADPATSTTDEMIQEAVESAGIMGQLNSYYKFRRFMKSSSPDAEAALGPAKLRMQSLGQLKLGKEKFELLAFALSVLNGCEQCVVSHDEALKKLGVSPEKIHDSARLSSVVFGVTQLIT